MPYLKNTLFHSLPFGHNNLHPFQMQNKFALTLESTKDLFQYGIGLKSMILSFKWYSDGDKGPQVLILNVYGNATDLE
jgi:hypothetical protein